MLTNEQIEKNKARYIDLIKSIKLEGSNIDGFLNWLNKSDFFEAPASVKYHCNFPGGLCQHSLNVYDNLLKLVDKFASHVEYYGDEDGNEHEMVVKQFSDDSIKLVALLHDISKTNYYEQYDKNVKNEDGSWVKVKEYKTRELEDRFIYGNHEQNSEFMAHTFFPLSVDESVAILHHHGGKAWDSSQDDVPAVFSRFPLALLLHTADMLSAYIDENTNESDN